MSLQFSAFGKSDWNSLIEKNQINDLFYLSSYHDVLALHYNCNCSYYQVHDNSDVLIAIPIFHRKKDATLITHFFYHAIYFNPILSERKKIEAFDLLASSLIKYYDKIDFKLEPKCQDVRAFVWNGYNSNTYYSYHLNLNEELNYSENINRQLKKYNKIYKVEKLNDYDEHIIEAHVHDMVKNGLGKSEAGKVKAWMFDFQKLGILNVFKMQDEQGVDQGSAIYINDKNTAYLIAVMSNNSSQALLYDRVFEYYRSLKINHIDLLGANIQNVAVYKSQFDAKLISYHIVSYRKNKVWESIKKAIKLKIKSIYK